MILCFGELELDTARFELRRSRQRVDVQPKVLRLLFYLAEHRERAVPAEELLRELWPETNVGAGSLKRAVLGARQALGERGESQSSIRTVRGHGYQFVRPVQVIGSVPPVTAPSGEPPAPAAVSGTPRDPFLGREPVMARLYASLEEARAGGIRCVLLTGVPGIGKTRAAEELGVYARERGARVWHGRCSDVEGVPAFWPFVQVLRDALHELGPAAMRDVMGASAGDIAEAMTELRQLLPDLPEADPLTTPLARFRFFDAIAGFLRRAAESGPIVVSLDDLHHADPATLHLVTFLVRQLDRGALLIVGTFRRELANAAPNLELDALVREERSRCIELSGLPRSALAEYVALATGREPPDAVLDALQEQTAGNPLFVRQVVESYRAAPDQHIEGLVRATGGLDLQGAIERHLEVVPDTCRGLLRTAAVLGREFPGALLARICDIPVGPVWQALSQAEATQLIEPLGSPPGHYRFTHALIRDALYHQLPTHERARLHGRAALALEADGIGESYVRLAEITRHCVLAAPAHDGGRALPYTLRAAETALTRLAYEEAADHFQCALQLCAYEAPDPRRRMTLLYRYGDALARTTQLPAAREAHFEVLGLARELGDADMLFEAASQLATRHEPGSVDTRQLAALRDAREALAEHDPRRVLLQASMAKSLAYAHDRPGRQRLARAALRDADRIDEPRLKAEVLLRCHEALNDPEALDERVRIASDLLELAHRRDDSAVLLRASAAQIETCIERGDMLGVESALTRMESLADRVREPIFRWRAKVVRATQAQVQGQIGLAEQRANEAFETGAPLGLELARHVYCVHSVTHHLMRGEPTKAEPLAREMAERYPEIPGWQARVAMLDWVLGRREQAQRSFHAIMARGLDWICSEPYVLSGLCAISELCALVRDRDAAVQLYAALEPFADHFGLTDLGAGMYGPMTRFLAMLAATRGDLALAGRHYAAALEGASELRSPTFSAIVAVLYAQLLFHQRERVQASALVALARERAGASGLHAVSEQCRYLDTHYQAR